MIQFFKNIFQIASWSFLSVIVFVTGLVIYALWPFTVTHELVIDVPNQGGQIVFVRSHATWLRDGYDRSVRFQKGNQKELETSLYANNAGPTDIQVFIADNILKLKDWHGTSWLDLSKSCMSDTSRPTAILSEWNCVERIHDLRDWKLIGRIEENNGLVLTK